MCVFFFFPFPLHSRVLYVCKYVSLLLSPLLLHSGFLPSVRACNAFLYVTEPARRSTLYALVFLPLGLSFPRPLVVAPHWISSLFSCCYVVVCYRWTWRNILFVSATRYCWERSITPISRPCHKASALSQFVSPPPPCPSSFVLAFFYFIFFFFSCGGETRGEGGGKAIGCLASSFFLAVRSRSLAMPGTTLHFPSSPLFFSLPPSKTWRHFS